MSYALESPELNNPWAPCEPDKHAPWNLGRIVHLHRRAGFAATWKGLQRDLADGAGPSIGRILSGKACTDATPEDFAHLGDMLGNEAVLAGDSGRLQGWWIYRMLGVPTRSARNSRSCGRSTLPPAKPRSAIRPGAGRCQKPIGARDSAAPVCHHRVGQRLSLGAGANHFS